MFKYYSHAGAIATLQNGTIQLSAPAAFNDPFDTHIDDPLGLDPEAFVQELQTAFLEFIFGEIDYTELRGGQRGEKIIELHRALAARSPEQREELRRQAANDDATALYDIDDLKRHNQEMAAYLGQNFSRYGIFCMSRQPDVLLMWSHYANEHRGFVFEFSPSAERDSPLLAARAVIYTNTRPLMYRTPAEMLRRSLMMSLEQATGEIIRGIVYSKAEAWAYEEEERLYIPDFVPEGEKHAFLQFHPEELTAVVIGCRSTMEQAQQVIALARKLNPSVRIKRALTDQREYRLCLVDEVGLPG